MGRKRRNSKILEQANTRLSGLKGIGDDLDLGSGLSVAVLTAAINNFRTRLDGYNQKLAELDDDLNVLQAEEAKLNELNGRMLAGVAAVYGRNSSEYEMAGGVRTGDRKRGGGNTNKPPDK